MTTVISPDAYCNNPADYANTPGLTDQTKLYWQQYCTLRSQLGQVKIPDNKSFANISSEVVQGFIESLFTPEGLAFMGVIFGGPILAQSAKEAVADFVSEGLDQKAITAAMEKVADGTSMEVANIALVYDQVTSKLAYVSLDAATDAGFDAGRYAIKLLFDFVDIVSDVLDVAMAVQMMGMLLDLWDPCDLNDQFDASQLQILNNNFNTVFRTNIAQGVLSTQDTYGNIVLNAEWPVPYYAELSAIIPFKNDYYDPIRQGLMMDYLNSLQFNSNGSPIFYTINTGRMISNDDISAIDSAVIDFLSGSNTVAENWLHKWWPLLAMMLIVIVLLIITIRRRNRL